MNTDVVDAKIRFIRVIRGQKIVKAFK